MTGRFLVVAVVAAALQGGVARVVAQAPADDASQRAEIRAQRDAADALYREREQACTKQFVVSSCIEAARKQRHDTLKQLDARQTALDDARRDARAAQRRAEIASKQSGEEARERGARAAERSAEAASGGAIRSSTPHTPAASMPAREAKPRPSPQQRAADEARARNAYALKQLQAEARRKDAERRNAEHARKTKTAAPLPVPGKESSAASAPAKERTTVESSPKEGSAKWSAANGNPSRESPASAASAP